MISDDTMSPGKVHPLPTGTRRKQHSVLSLLEAMDDILGMPPNLHQREGHPALHLVVDSAHEGIRSKQHQRVAMGGVHQPADLFYQTLGLHFAAHWRFRQVPGM